MAQTKIEWTASVLPDGTILPGFSFNPWLGCTKVSKACDSCYAEAWAKRSGLVRWGNHPRRRTSESNWKQPLKWNRDASKAGARKRVFCASLADVFDNQADFVWRRDLWHLIEDTPALDWLLLTKRPQNIAKMLPERYGNLTPWPWPNVWLGTTVENQEEADRRIPHLLAVPAAVRFLSCEPLLRPIDLRALYHNQTLTDALDGMSETNVVDAGDRMVAVNPKYLHHAKINWVIAGGESGPNARPMHPDWVRSLRDQCSAAGVPFFFKQWGEWLPFDNGDDDSWYAKHPQSLPLRFWRDGADLPADAWDGAGDDFQWTARIGKKAAGALLDRIEWRQTPTPGAA